MGGRGSRGRALPQVGAETGTVSPAPAEPEEPTEPTGAPVDRVRSAYTEVLAEAVAAGDIEASGGYISLVSLRAKLGDSIPRAEVDAALRDLLDNNPNVWIEPEVHGHRIGPAERAAAIRIGGEDRHKIHIAPPQ